jgi:4-methylaminobutanoate oxidase (formaldehyde-forming)
MSKVVPSQAKAVVVGGGIVGCSVAYHLASLGWTDTIVLEQKKLAGGSTWHSAGQVGRLRVSRSMTEVNKYGRLFSRLEAEPDCPGWKATGGLMVAASEDRLTTSAPWPWPALRHRGQIVDLAFVSKMARMPPTT